MGVLWQVIFEVGWNGGRLSHTARRRLLLVLGVAFLLRLAFGLTRDGLSNTSDERHWDGVARAFWLSGLVHSDAGTYRPPLYPLLVAATYTAVGHSPIVVRIWQAILGTATCALLFMLGNRVGGPATAILCAGLGALHPLMIYLSGVLMAETLLVFLMLSCLLAWLRMDERPGSLRAAVFGALLGLAVLTKPVVLVVAPLALVGGIIRSGDRMRAARHAGIGFALLLITVAPWTVRNRVLTGQWVVVSSNLGMNLLVGNEPEADGGYDNTRDYLALFAATGPAGQDPVAHDQSVAEVMLRQMLANPLRTAALGMKKTLLFWSPVLPGERLLSNLLLGMTSGGVLALGLAGLYGTRGSALTWAVGAFALSLTLVHAIFFAHVRFRLPVEVSLLPAAAWMAQRAASGLQAAIRLRRIRSCP